jgi:hypothetical protein
MSMSVRSVDPPASCTGAARRCQKVDCRENAALRLGCASRLQVGLHGASSLCQSANHDDDHGAEPEMTAAGKRRGLVVRHLYINGDPAKPYDAGEIEAERLHLSEITGFDIRYVHFDKMFNDEPLTCHLRFLEVVGDIRPEFIFVHQQVFYDTMHTNVRAEVLYAARLLHGPRLIFSFGDLGYELQTALQAGYAAIGDISVSWDGNGSRLAKMAPGKTVLDFAAPRDERIFRDLGLVRDVDVSFAGSLHHYPDRREMIIAVRKLGIPVVAKGGDQVNYLTLDGYVELLNRSKISLNFSKTTAGVHQIKGRVIESILCGALVFESENDVTPRYLTPYRHYVPFSDAADLAVKVRRYLDNDAARRAIVTAAREHVAANLSERAWWRGLLGELDRQWAELVRQQQGAASA